MTRPYKPAHLSPAEWIFVRTDCPPEPDACWIWTGSQNGDGYGKIAVGKKLVLVHRLAYEAKVGPIPDGWTIDHLCNVRACIRPSHLEPVTRRENVQRGYERRGMGRASDSLREQEGVAA